MWPRAMKLICCQLNKVLYSWIGTLVGMIPKRTPQPNIAKLITWDAKKLAGGCLNWDLGCIIPKIAMKRTKQSLRNCTLNNFYPIQTF